MSFIPGWFPNLWDSRVPPLNFVGGNNDLNNLSTYTATNFAIGAAFTGRQVFVAMMGQGATQTITSATIGGVAATFLGQSSGSNGTIAIFAVPFPTGTTATIVANFSGTMQRMSFHVWTGSGWLLTPFAAAANVSLTSPKTMAVNVQSGGAVIATVNLIAPGTAAASFSGVTFDSNIPVENVANTIVSGHQAALAGQLSRAIGITSTSGTPTLFQGLAVSLAPAA